MTCAGDVGTGPAPISHLVIDDVIECVNTEARTNAAGNAIELSTINSDHFITLNTDGTLSATSASVANGVYTRTNQNGGGGDNSYISITQYGEITATSTGASANGVYARTNGADATINILRSGDVTALSTASYALGVNASTEGADSTIVVNTSGFLSATGVLGAYGIRAFADGQGSSITLTNTGGAEVEAEGIAYGIFAETAQTQSSIGITNSGDLTVTSFSVGDVTGIHGYTYDTYSSLTLSNDGDLVVTATDGRARGIYLRAERSDGFISLTNNGDVTVTSLDGSAFGVSARTDGTANGQLILTNRGRVDVTSNGLDAWGIFGETRGSYSNISLVNSGYVRVVGPGYARGVFADTFLDHSPIGFFNTGDVYVDGRYATGVFARTVREYSTLSLFNAGNVTARGLDYAYGIKSRTEGDSAPAFVINRGELSVTATDDAFGIWADTFGTGSPLSIQNNGDVFVSGGGDAFGIYASTQGVGSYISVVNFGDISVTGSVGISILAANDSSAITVQNAGDINARGYGARAISVRAAGTDSPVEIVSTGNLTARGFGAFGIVAYTNAANSSLSITTSGDTRAIGTGATAMFVQAQGANSSVTIENSGSAYGTARGIYAFSDAGTTIINAGNISAGSLLAIEVQGSGNASISNFGTITGFVTLDADDTFVNQSGGTFEARQTSDFGIGTDLFRNVSGGTVHTANSSSTKETTSFVNLERFENAGLISLQDGGAGDTFRISQTVGGTGLDFVASGHSTLAVDAFLGKKGVSDTFVIDGNVSGKTEVTVVNTSSGPGAFTKGIPVVYVEGNVQSDAFYLDRPIDTGFFVYDLFFRPTGSGIFELRSTPGGGAYLLPQLVTAAQDIWHEGSSTWFDRTADLRVLLNGAPAPTAYDYGGKSLGVGPQDNLTPAVWARGSGSWLSHDDSASTRAYGRNYTFNLDRDLETIDFQTGLDLGKRDFLSQGDALVFGVLGGFVHGDLDYDNLARHFDFDGAQVGAYATYLKGGLFVDTLANVHLYSLDTGTLGFPGSLDASTFGLRTDTGYRFGSFSGGPFLEPLATIEVMWADIDGFSLGGNTVSFGDDPDVRGRVGLRAGTTMEAWTGTVMEPFVIASLWGNFTDDNQAILVSSGRTFRFEDDLQDVWGEISGGVNLFNFSQTTSVFAKADVSFGDDLTGVGGKAGMRVAW